MPKSKQSRLIIARLTLRLLQHYSNAILQNQNYGQHAQDIVILLGAAIGTHENKPMTAAKLSEYVCVPRATTVRRVAGLVEAGLLVLDDKKQIYLSQLANERAEKTAPVLNSHAIMRTAAFLSNLDTNPIAPNDGQ